MLHSQDMKKSIILNGATVEYMLTVRPQAKRIKLTVGAGGVMKVSVPRFVPQYLVEDFMKRKELWIMSALERSLAKQSLAPADTEDLYEKHKEAARMYAHAKVEHYNSFYNFSWKRIAIRNQKTRWGSCSKQGNLNFSYKLALLPEHLVDYIVVHELCHLGEFNHSEKFWNLVARVFPEYKALRKELNSWQ